MMQLKAKLASGIVLLLLFGSCGQRGLEVIHMPSPDYPLEARFEGIQGVVLVRVGIGTDGSVLYATGTGPNPLLVHSAEENARRWVFRVPAHARFPLEHEIRYTFKFDRQGAPNLMPTVQTDLPEAVEIIGTPAIGDKVILIPPKKGK